MLVIRDAQKTELGYRGNKHVHILIVTEFKEDEETNELMVYGYVFKNPRAGHSNFKNNLRPLDLSLLGIHEALKTELSVDIYPFNFLDSVIGKAFPYHLVLTGGKSNANPSPGNECLDNQKWIFIRLMHTRNPKTLLSPPPYHCT